MQGPSKRERRPWWRWNLTTLAVVLFVLLWSRELTGWSPRSTWGLVAAIGLGWAAAPAVIAPDQRRRLLAFIDGSGTAARAYASKPSVDLGLRAAGIVVAGIATAIVTLPLTFGIGILTAAILYSGGVSAG